VLITHDFPTAEDAGKFAGDPDLQAGMARVMARIAGLSAEPPAPLDGERIRPGRLDSAPGDH
jgi:hypothetical protein